MKNKKETAFSGLNTESGYHGTGIPDQANCTKPFEKKQGIVEKSLKKGSENAISAIDLAYIVGCNNTRQLRKLVSKERAQGALILSCDEGYFLPSDGLKGKTEAERFIAWQTSRSLNTLRILHTAKVFLATLDGQQHVEGL